MDQSGKRARVLVAPIAKVVESHNQAADLDGERSQFRNGLDTFSLITDLIKSDGLGFVFMR